MIRFGPRIYFAQDSESVEDWDDDISEEDWENFTDDSSDILSHINDSTSDDNAVTGRELQSLLNNDAQASPIKKCSIERHMSVPNISLISYETPVIDHSDMKPDLCRNASTRKKRVSSIMKLNFHG